MKIELFHTPIYKVKVDLSKIQIESGPYIKSFKSRTPSTISTENKLSSYSRKYLLEIFKQYLPFKNMSILNIWKNKYLSGDYQEIHIHAQSNFSFIIYEKIKECKTVFLNPAWKQIVGYFDESYLETRKTLECSVGDMVIFPSYLEHFVDRHEEEAITISGNIKVDVNEDV
jgi:hypothetical protein|tara:strand:+ start:1817 stop:2329 length:513 start_codon:yes stop_codon:yes gene_type:complete